MMTYSMFGLIVVLLIHQSKTEESNPAIGWTRVKVNPRPEPRLPVPQSVSSSSAHRPTMVFFDTTTTRSRISTSSRPIIYSDEITSLPVITAAFKLNDSNCYCSYNRQTNLLLCTPDGYSTSFSSLFFSTVPSINVTLNACTFSSNRFTLTPLKSQQTIDQLRLININNGNYLVFDRLSFSFYNIAHLYISYFQCQQMTMLLISNKTFPLSSTISQSLRSIDIDTCYIVTVFNPFSSLLALESISMIDIDHFSWYDFRQQIVRLPRLRTVNIRIAANLTNGALANILQCEDIPTLWTLIYDQIQSCSCALIPFYQTIDRMSNIINRLYRCSNVEYPIDLISNLCQFNGEIYDLTNRLETFFCNQCRTMSCPNGTWCTEIAGSNPLCVPLSRIDYAYIRSRLPKTPLTEEFLRQQIQYFLPQNPNQSLEPMSVDSIATILINSSANHVEISPDHAQIFHQTLSQMLQRPWAPSVFMAPVLSTNLWQQLFLSLDEIVLNINDSDPMFEFQSPPLSSVSLRFPTGNQPIHSYGWQISNDNIITSNITATQAVGINITSRIFLKMPDQQQQQQTPCDPSKSNCSNRYGVTSIKSPKLFLTTDRIPEYDVLSLVAPSRKQQVTFYFDRKLSPQNLTDYTTTTTTTNTTNSFYDQLDLMIIEGMCMYLNTTSMIWQSDGCTTDRDASNSTSVTCTCEHLTMFTVFFSSSCAVPSKFLDILSWLGCCLSLIGLLVTLIMFIVISQYRQANDSNNGGSSSQSGSSQELRRRLMSKPRRLSMVKSMLFVLCILLIAMNILILILTFVKPGRNRGCTILASLLYYFTLATFIWKFLFALQQSIFITSLLQQRWSDRILFLIYSIVTFSLPLCPVLIMNFIFQNATFISSTCDYCWLTREFVIYALMIPILTITCLNFILYSYTMIRLCLKNRQQPGLRSTKTDDARRMQNLKIGLFFAIVMGLGWIVGFLLFIPNSILQLIGNILFCLVNTMQGFAFSIMVFCMLERTSFRKCCCFWRYKKQSTTPNQVTGSSPIVPQQSIPTSLPISNENLTKMKPLHSSSTNTTTSDHYHANKLPSEREEDEEEEDPYSVPVF